MLGAAGSVLRVDVEGGCDAVKLAVPHEGAGKQPLRDGGSAH